MNEKFCILNQISLKFDPEGPINNKSALVQVMAWRQAGAKPLPEPKLAQFTDAYMWNWGEMSWNVMCGKDWGQNQMSEARCIC